VEAKLVQFLLLHPERLDEAGRVVTPEDFHDPALRQIFAIAGREASGGRAALDRALAEHPDAEIGAAARGLLMVDPKEYAEDPDRILRDFLRTMADQRQRRENTRIRQQIKAAEAVKDEQAIAQLKAAHEAWRRATGVP
jgi:hypothetical protein